MKASSPKTKTPMNSYWHPARAPRAKFRNPGKTRSWRTANRIFHSNIKDARSNWGELPETTIRNLREISLRHAVSIAAGELQLLDGRWYVTSAGLLNIAQRKLCAGISTALVKNLCDPCNNRWIFKATVYKRDGSKGFVGYGDADPSNVSPLVRGAEMRVAETRAVNRALRKAYGIGLCSVEELGWTPRVSGPPQSSRNGSSAAGANGNGHSALSTSP